MTIALLTSLMLSTAMVQAADPSAMPEEAKALIEALDLEPIPHEGAYFRQTHKSSDVIEGALGARYASPRYAYTAIYTLMTAEGFSAMHRLATDELWHFYGGDPAEMLLLFPDGRSEVRVLGNDIAAGERPQIMVPAGVWMGARPIGEPAEAYTFFGNTLSPGFEYEDYETGYRDELTEAYPDRADLITALTRSDSLSRPADDPAPEMLIDPITIEEEIGRIAPVRSDELSVARFIVQAGTSLPVSYNEVGTEAFIVTEGRGTVTIGEDEIPVKRDSVVFLPPIVPHTVSAETRLVFYAIVAPAYSPEDNVVVEPAP